MDKIGGDRDLAISSVKTLTSFNQAYGLVDAFRNLHPSTRSYTWSSANDYISCRLDRFYVSREIFNNASSCNVKFFPYSDHNAVILCFQPPNIPTRGPGIWKFNTSLLMKFVNCSLYKIQSSRSSA